MKLIGAYLKQHRMGIVAYLLFCVILCISFWLYHLPIAAAVYPVCICTLFGLVMLWMDFHRICSGYHTLEELKKRPAALLDGFPKASGIVEKDYQELVRLLCDEQRRTEADMHASYADMVDYYTIWAHQIKTPIASMRLQLQNEDSELSRRLSTELFRIEQYVEMVLLFLRIDSESTDYCFREYDLDELIRQSVRKFSTEFILRKLSLCYEPIHLSVITDEKWFSFVLDQVLSNALKYTQSGSITIRMEEPATLCICDTGIGIAPEDLPRIFEKGYTGYNGRTDRKSSGLGLWLCKRICNNLGYGISASSQVDAGTVIRINLSQQRPEIE